MAYKDIEKRRANWRRYYQRRGKNRYKQPNRKAYLKVYTKQWRKNHIDYSGYSKKSRENSFKHFIKSLLTKIRHRCKCHRRLENNLTIEYMLDLLEFQKEKCAITFLPLLHEFGKLRTISIDRIDSNKGYIQGNVQFVCRFVNLGKNSSTNEEVIQFFKDVKND